MPFTALLLVLAAGVVHATWNLLLSGAEDTHAATAVVAGVVAFGPAAAMSFVYPIARGSAPVFVLGVSVVALGGRISALGGVGVLLIAGGIVLVRGLANRGRPRDLALTLAVGGCIASYTLVDKPGIVHGGPIVLGAGVRGDRRRLPHPTWRLRGARALRAAITWPTLVAGVGFFASYALTLAALSIAPAAPVAAVRETSVVIAAAVLVASGRERLRIDRVIGSAIVVAGIACIAFG